MIRYGNSDTLVFPRVVLAVLDAKNCPHHTVRYLRRIGLCAIMRVPESTAHPNSQPNIFAGRALPSPLAGHDRMLKKTKSLNTRNISTLLST